MSVVDDIIESLEANEITFEQGRRMMREEFERITSREVTVVKRKPWFKSIKARLLSHRIWGPYDPQLRSRCWYWNGNHKKPEHGGYPLFALNKHYCTHAIRAAYEHILSKEPPLRGSGKELSHICETGARCWNPRHVIEESHQSNCRRIPKERVNRACATARSHINLLNLKHEFCKAGHLLSETRIYRSGLSRCGSCLRDYAAMASAKKRSQRAVNKLIRQHNLVSRVVFVDGNWCGILEK